LSLDLEVAALGYPAGNMTLHGGSGTRDEHFQQAIKAGMIIVHVNTELCLAWRRCLENALQTRPSEIAPYKILPAVGQPMSEVKAIASVQLPLATWIQKAKWR